MAHDITSCTDISCIIEPHIGDNLAEKPPPIWGKFFDTRSIHFRQFQATLVFVAEKPPPRWGNFLTPDLSISGNLSKFGFCGRKAPPPHEGKFLDIRSIHFRQFWANLVFVAERPPNEGKFLTPDLSISGNFKQLWFLWQKSPPPPRMKETFDTRSIHFRQFRATLVFVAEKPHPASEKFFDTRSIHFR